MEDISLSERHALVKTLVKETFGREVSSIAPLGRDSNNFVYQVSLVPTSPSTPIHLISSPRPGTKPLSQSTQEVVVRLSNPDAMLNNAVRVENEVAAIKLMQAALAGFPTKIVPDVYAWNTAGKDGHGWIVQQHMLGSGLSARFPELSESQRAHVLEQIAQVFKLIQSFTPPVTDFGGLNFDAEGRIVTGELTIWFDGPFASFAEMYMSIFRKQMELSKSTPLVNGWKDTSLANRLENFENSGGIVKLLKDNLKVQPTLIHGDLSLENILFDPETFQLTALLDFDFTHIASPADEYFYSFMDFHGLVPGPFEGEEMEMLRRAQLSGFQGIDFVAPTEPEIDWTTARLWQKAIEKAGLQSPAEIEGLGEIAAVYWFLQDICPPYFLLPRWIKRRTDEELEAARKEVEVNLDRYLTRWGY